MNQSKQHTHGCKGVGRNAPDGCLHERGCDCECHAAHPAPVAAKCKHKFVCPVDQQQHMEDRDCWKWHVCEKCGRIPSECKDSEECDGSRTKQHRTLDTHVDGIGPETESYKSDPPTTHDFSGTSSGVAQPEAPAPTTRDRFDEFADEVAERCRFFKAIGGMTMKDIAFVARQWFGTPAVPPSAAPSAEQEAREWLEKRIVSADRDEYGVTLYVGKFCVGGCGLPIEEQVKDDVLKELAPEFAAYARHRDAGKDAQLEEARRMEQKYRDVLVAANNSNARKKQQIEAKDAQIAALQQDFKDAKNCIARLEKQRDEFSVALERAEAENRKLREALRCAYQLFNQERELGVPVKEQQWIQLHDDITKILNNSPEAIPRIYIASRTRHAARWRSLRDGGYPIISTWIDEAGVGETKDFTDLWTRAVFEASTATALIAYSEGDEDLVGGLIEVGAALGRGVPVFLVGEGDGMGKMANHPCAMRCGSLDIAFEMALSPAAEGEKGAQK